MILGRKATAF